MRDRISQFTFILTSENTGPHPTLPISLILMWPCTEELEIDTQVSIILWGFFTLVISIMTKIVLIEPTLSWLNLKYLQRATASNQGNPNYSTQFPFLPKNQLSTVAKLRHTSIANSSPTSAEEATTSPDQSRSFQCQLCLLYLDKKAANQIITDKQAITIQRCTENF